MIYRLPASVETDVLEFCDKHGISYANIDDRLKIEDFFKGIIDKYLDLSLYTDERIQNYIESEIESATDSKFEDGYEDGKVDGYDDGYQEGFSDGVNAQIKKAEHIGK